MWAAIVIIVIALLLVLAAPKPKVENARAANLGDFQFPRSKEGDPVPWFLGTVRLKAPNSLWYGDYTPFPIKKKQKTGMFSSKKVTVGYKYHIGLDLCWCLGGTHPVTLRKLWSDKYVFWSGVQSTPGTLSVNLPNLFGGDEQRGGMIGNIDYYPGSFTETRNSYLATKADPEVPAYIGQTRTVFRGSANTFASGFYFGTTTNINAISAEMTRLASNVSPTYSIMPNGLDVNPMELLHAGFTEKFGMPGVSTADIDLPSWQACAQQLYNEGFGMSLLVQQSITGKDLTEEVLRIADGILYQDTDTGKMVAKLIRDDYDIGTLPIVDDSVVRELTKFTKTTWEQTYNQCRVTFKDRANEYADRAATAQDFANINFQQRVKNTDISVPGCFVNDEANKLAVRQLSLLSVPLFQMELRCNRKASNLKPGDVFVFEYPLYGISNMVMRVQKINKGTLKDGIVTLNVVQDRFATALAVFAPPTGSGWVPVNTDAAPVSIRRVEELPYWWAQFANVAPTNTQGLITVLANPPASASVFFDVDYTTNADSTWANPIRILGEAPYYGSGVLQAAYDDQQGRTTGTDATGFTLESVAVPSALIDSNGTFDNTGQMLLLMGNEFMSAANLTVNMDGSVSFSGIRRALFDTDFESHALGARCYIIQQNDDVLETYLDDQSTWRMRYIDNTPSSTLDPALATQNTLAMTRRMFRPAPPDYVTIEGSRTPADVAGGSSITLAWRERNRKTLTVVPYDAATEAQEAAVDYGWRYSANGGAWSAYTYVSGTSTVVPVPAGVNVLDYEVWSRRDGLLSRTGDRCTVETFEPLPTGVFRAAVLADSPTWFSEHDDALNATVCNNIGSGADGTYSPKLSNQASAIYSGGGTCWNNSASDWVDIPASCLPSPTSEFTLECMVNESVLANYQALIDRDQESGVRKWQWRGDTSGIQNFIQIISGVSTVSGAGATAGATCLLGVRVKADGECTIWKNGDKVTTSSVPTGLDWGHNTVGLRVLRRLQGDSANTGKCAASVIFNTALSDARMLAHAQAAGLHT